MSNIVLFSPDDYAFATFDWSDVLPPGVDLDSVVHNLPAPLLKSNESVNGALSQVKIKNAVHAALYQISATAILTNGESIKRTFPLRGFNS